MHAPQYKNWVKNAYLPEFLSEKMSHSNSQQKNSKHIKIPNVIRTSPSTITDLLLSLLHYHLSHSWKQLIWLKSQQHSVELGSQVFSWQEVKSFPDTIFLIQLLITFIIWKTGQIAWSHSDARCKKKKVSSVKKMHFLESLASGLFSSH